MPYALAVERLSFDMPKKPNYDFEKRKKEQDRKKKKDAKREERLQRKRDGSSGDVDETDLAPGESPPLVP
jgi:hypothetical protein